MNTICEIIKRDKATNKMDKAYGKIKRLSRLPKPRNRIVMDKNGQLILDEGKIMMKWKEYIEGLVEENNIFIKNITESNKDDIRSNITKIEFVKALHELKQGKTPEVGDIPAKLLKKKKYWVKLIWND